MSAVSKKYQMFVSSTFKDLVEQRKAIINAVLDLDHIPSGMELFPSADMEQFEYIKRMIDACDYYILVIGSRYGQVDGDGISFTEREFDYAVEKKKIVLAFIQRDDSGDAGSKVDIDQAAAKRLESFKTKVTTGRLVTFWTSLDNLMRNFMQSVARATRDMPATGWVRADAVASDDLLRQINDLRIENDKLKSSVGRVVSAGVPEEALAGLGKIIDVTVNHLASSSSGFRRIESHTSTVSFSGIYKFIAPNLITWSERAHVDAAITGFFKEILSVKVSSVIKSHLDMIRIQFVVLGLVAQSVDQNNAEVYMLTEKGFAEMFRLIAVKN